MLSKPKNQHLVIIFIDEIDAVGRKRGGGLGWWSRIDGEQTLTNVSEMDGLKVHERYYSSIAAY